MTSFRAALLKEAKRRFDALKEEGTRVATLSPSPHNMIMHFIDELDLSSLSVVIELGCGDGRWMHAIERKFKCTCIGIEIEPQRLKVAGELGQANDCKLCEYVLGDFFSSINLKMVSHVIFYLSVDGNKRVLDKVLKECLAGTILISCGFQMPDMIPLRTFQICGLFVYEYIL